MWAVVELRWPRRSWTHDPPTDVWSYRPEAPSGGEDLKDSSAAPCVTAICWVSMETRTKQALYEVHLFVCWLTQMCHQPITGQQLLDQLRPAGQRIFTLKG